MATPGKRVNRGAAQCNVGDNRSSVSSMHGFVRTRLSFVLHYSKISLRDSDPIEVLWPVFDVAMDRLDVG